MYPYVSNCKDMNQYADLDFRYHKVVEAKYIDTGVFRGNLFIEALPPEQDHSSTDNAQINQSETDITALSDRQRLTALSKIHDFRCKLPFYDSLKTEIRRSIISSYANKDAYISNSDDEIADIKVNNGFALLGFSGCGKSSSINMEMDHYPQVIIHNIQGERVVQVVYLYVSCDAHGDLHTLFLSIAEAMDTALSNGNHMYEELIKNTMNLKKETFYIQRIFEKFHIGIIFIDEIQNMDFARKKNNSFNIIANICNQQHIGLCVIGLEDVFYNLFSLNEAVSRLPMLISASSYCSDYAESERIINALFSLGFTGGEVPDKEVMLSFIMTCGGAIAPLVQLYYYLAMDYVKETVKPIIDMHYVRRIAIQKLGIAIRSMNRFASSPENEYILRRQIAKDMKIFIQKQSSGSLPTWNSNGNPLKCLPVEETDGILHTGDEAEVTLNTEAVLYKILSSQCDNRNEEY